MGAIAPPAGDAELPAPVGRSRIAAAELPEHVLAALRSGRPLTVLRGPRGYGKTSAIRQWLSELDDGVPVLYLNLTEDSNEVPGFWREFRTFLDANGVTVHERGDERWSVVSTLVEHPGRLLLVIDDFHEAGLDEGAASIDDDLVEIVRQNDGIDLVIGTRTYRTLETTGMLSVDGVVLGPDDLKMTGQMVYALAQRLGVDMTLDQAQEIAVDTGGWPSAIRAGLVQSGATGTFNAGLVDDYIVNLINDLRFPSVRAFLLRTAIPERFTADMAQLIAPSMTLRILRNLRNAGLLSETHTSDGRMYSYAPAVRNALLRLGRELEPETAREVHHTLMEIAAAARDPARVLIHAVEAQEYDSALQIIEREWSTLLASNPLALMEAARRFPPEIAGREPRLRIVLNELHAAPSSESSRFTVDGGSTFAAELAEHMNAPVGSSNEESLALMQWGITCLLVGNLDAASYAFNRARTLGLVGGGPDETVELAALGLAVSHAFEGEPELALRWLEDPGVADRLGQVHKVDGRDIAVVTAQLARTLALTDMADPGAAEAAAAMTEPGHRDGLWAGTVFARAHHAAFSGERSEISRMSNEVRAAMRHISRGSLYEVLLASVLVELLIADNAVDVAQQVVNRFPGTAMMAAAEAKAALAARRYPQAIAAAKKAIGVSQRTWRTAVECQVVLASAYHATGDAAGAHEAFRHAVRMAQGIGQRRPFLLMPRFLFDGFAAGDPKIESLWPGSRPQSDTPVTAPSATTPSELPTLTSREIQILRALETHPGPVGIGSELGLSVNTVKTHLRAVYRKLGVSSRTEALAAIGGTRRAT